MDEQLTRGATQCTSPRWGQGDFEAHVMDSVRSGEGDFEMNAQVEIIPLSRDDVKYIPETQCIYCEQPSQVDNETFGEGVQEALSLFQFLDTHTPGAYVLVETDAASDRHGRYCLYLVPAKVWNKVKVDLLPDCAD